MITMQMLAVQLEGGKGIWNITAEMTGYEPAETMFDETCDFKAYHWHHSRNGREITDLLTQDDAREIRRGLLDLRKQEFNGHLEYA
jgi:hypothetical protein